MIRSCNKIVKNHGLIEDPVDLYHVVKEFGIPNFLGAIIQVNFDMNLDLLDSLLVDYWDWQLPFFLRYGFPMNFFGSDENLSCDTSAHASAQKFPQHVLNCLQDECQHKAIRGPFSQKPFGNKTHIISFHSEKRRVIVDLSWPMQSSVNDFTPGNEYFGAACKIQHPTVDDFTERLLYLGRGALMYKIDLARAFRQLKVDPLDYPRLCLKWTPRSRLAIESGPSG